MDALQDELALLKHELDNAHEREAIVARYDKGRDGPVDPWENPQFEVYHTKDRYGFIHNTRLPESDQREKDNIKLELQRIDKWLKMIANWPLREREPAKLARRVYKGIPDRLRGRAWVRLLRVEETMADHKNVYETMRKRARMSSPDIRQIDLDVNRTYRDHIDFRERYGVKQQALFHVLAAYSMYNTEVGYCQGMSQIAALLLMYMTEEQAFWALSQLLTDKTHGMHGMFIPGFPKLMRFQDHFERVLQKYIPKIAKYLKDNCLPPSLYALKWFMQCFLDRTPFSLTLRLWDVHMLEGERMLIPMAYMVFKLHQKSLLKLPMELFVTYLQRDLEMDFGFEDDNVLSQLKICMEDLKRAGLDVPSTPASAAELPSKQFGLTRYPTKEDILLKMRANNERDKVTNHVFMKSDDFIREIRESMGKGHRRSDRKTPSVSSAVSTYDNVVPTVVLPMQQDGNDDGDYFPPDGYDSPPLILMPLHAVYAADSLRTVRDDDVGLNASAYNGSDLNSARSRSLSPEVEPELLPASDAKFRHAAAAWSPSPVAAAGLRAPDSGSVGYSTASGSASRFKADASLNVPVFI